MNVQVWARNSAQVKSYEAGKRMKRLEFEVAGEEMEKLAGS